MPLSTACNSYRQAGRQSGWPGRQPGGGFKQEKAEGETC